MSTSVTVTRSLRRPLCAVALFATTLYGCKGVENGAADPRTNCQSETGVDPAGMPVQPTEWVGYHVEIPIAFGDIHPLVSGLIGDDAEAKHPIAERELTTGVFVEAASDPATPDQSRLTFSIDDGGKTRRTLAVAPASFALGKLFGATLDAAVAKMNADEAAKKGSGEAWFLEYRVSSPLGGRLSLGFRADANGYVMVLDVGSPRTSLEVADIGKPSGSTQPYDTIAGTVWFHLSKDDFDYFVDHAYGKGATGRQNFHDFMLVPHDWLRLTVDPHLDQKFVSVGFEVVTLDGKRTPVTKAPASVLAGKAFQAAVDRAMANMLNQEKAKPGSSTPFSVPFYYDAPVSGGVVQVIAQGVKGSFTVAYAVESPRHFLKDVPFVEYEPVDIPAEDPLAKATCDKLGDPTITLADKGTLDMKFVVSDIVKNSPDLTHPLQGTLSCSIYAAQDVNVDGPKKGTVTIQDFDIPAADLSGGSVPAPTFVSQSLHDGQYQVLCFQDIDGSGDPTPGDPVTLPIGSFPVACNRNPTTVELAILYPKP